MDFFLKINFTFAVPNEILRCEVAVEIDDEGDDDDSE